MDPLKKDLFETIINAATFTLVFAIGVVAMIIFVLNDKPWWAVVIIVLLFSFRTFKMKEE